MIRDMELRDVPKLRELSDYQWPLGASFVGATVRVNEQDEPVMFLGRWRLAEVHAVGDKSWRTPAHRLIAMDELESATREKLRSEGVEEVVTWFQKPEAICRRLLRNGWMKIERMAFGKAV